VKLRFTPTGLGNKNTDVTATAANVTGTVTVVSAQGRGVVTAELTTSIATMNFGSIALGHTPSGNTLTVWNRMGETNSQATGPISITLTGTGAADFAFAGCQTETQQGLTGGGSCLIAVAFTPKTIGVRDATLTISGTPGGSVSVNITGTGAPSIILDKASETFTATAPNNKKTFTASLTPASAMQTETGPLSVVIGGTDAALWQFSMNTCQGKSLKPGDTMCTVELIYTGMAGMNKMGTITVSGTTAGNVASATLTAP
jgi:hypothetical protein